MFRRRETDADATPFSAMAGFDDYRIADRLSGLYRLIGILDKVLEDAMAGTLTAAGFARHWRSRRSYAFYLKSILNAAAAQKRPDLELRICRSVTRRMKAPRFAARLAELTGAEG